MMRLRCRLGRHYWVYRMDPLTPPPSLGARLTKRCLYCHKGEHLAFPASPFLVTRETR